VKNVQQVTELLCVSCGKPQHAVAALMLLSVVRVGAQHDSSNASTDRRPVVSADYDTWRTIQSQQLSRDGRRVAYALVPQAGDAEVVVRDIASDTRYARHWAGARAGIPRQHCSSARTASTSRSKHIWADRGRPTQRMAC